MAFQSVFMLMILTRTVGVEEAVVFTIANANVNFFLTIGKYGMRNFQVFDLKNQFLFSTQCYIKYRKSGVKKGQRICMENSNTDRYCRNYHNYVYCRGIFYGGTCFILDI